MKKFRDCTRDEKIGRIIVLAVWGVCGAYIGGSFAYSKFVEREIARTSKAINEQMEALGLHPKKKDEEVE